MSAQRVRFRDVKPYATVDTLGALAGPSGGEVSVPRHLFWSGTQRTFDVADPADRLELYGALLANGTAEDIAAYVNKDRLMESWPMLPIDPRVVQLWADRFPSWPASNGSANGDSQKPTTYRRNSRGDNNFSVRGLKPRLQK